MEETNLAQLSRLRAVAAAALPRLRSVQVDKSGGFECYCAT